MANKTVKTQAKSKTTKSTKASAHKAQRSKNQLWITAGILLAVIVFAVGIVLFSNQNKETAYPPEISVAQAYEKYQDGVFLLDVRTQEEWNEYHAPNTTLIPLDELPQRLGELPKDQEIVVVCRSGNRSQTGRDILLDAGFEKVTSMAGGLSAWRTAGFPVEP